MGPPLGQQTMLELPLDEDLLKVLSSDSRREILRLLTERRMTGSELAHRLDLGKPAVAEHLKRLTEADLITRMDDPERKWVYYELSARGRSLLEPQKVRFYLVLGIAALAMALGVALTFGFQAALDTFAAPEVEAIDAGQADGLGGASEGVLAFGPVPSDGIAVPPTLAPVEARPWMTLHLAAPEDGNASLPSLNDVVAGDTFEIALDEAPPELGNGSSQEFMVLFDLVPDVAANGTLVVQTLSLPAANATAPDASPSPSPPPAVTLALDVPGATTATAAPAAPSEAPQKLVCTAVAVPAQAEPLPAANVSASPAPTPAAAPPLGTVLSPAPAAPSPSPTPTAAPPAKTIVVCNLVESAPAPAAPAGSLSAAQAVVDGNVSADTTPQPTVAQPSAAPAGTPATPSASPASAPSAAPAAVTGTTAPPAFSATPWSGPAYEVEPTLADDAASPSPNPAAGQGAPPEPTTVRTAFADPGSSPSASPPSPSPTPLASSDLEAPNLGQGTTRDDAPARERAAATRDDPGPTVTLPVRPILAVAVLVAAALALVRWGPGSRP